MAGLVDLYCCEIALDLTESSDALDEIAEFLADQNVFRYWISIAGGITAKEAYLFLPKGYENMAVWITLMPYFKSLRKI